jgi:hypothetical protein
MKLLPLAAIALLAGCAATGPAIEPAQLAAFQKGKTTQADVVRQFGRPSINSKNMDGTQTSAYLQPDAGTEAGSVISLMSAIAGRPTANVDSVIFEFDTKGILTDYRTTQSNPAAAASVPATPAQPVPVGTAQPAQPAPSGSIQPAQSTAGTGSAPSTAAQAAKPATTAAPRPPATPKRTDGLPSWLPSSSTKDPRAPF